MHKKTTTAKKSTTSSAKAVTKPETAPKTESVSVKSLYTTDLVYYHRLVKDFNGMRRFYREILELEPGDEGFSEYGWCDFKLPVEGARLGLARTDSSLNHTDQADSLNISVTNIEKLKQTLTAKGVKTGEIEDIPDMVSMMDSWDLEGNKIQFLGQPRVKSK